MSAVERNDDEPSLIGRTPTPLEGRPPLTARSVEVTLDSENVADFARFFEHLAKLLRQHGRVKVTIE